MPTVNWKVKRFGFYNWVFSYCVINNMDNKTKISLGKMKPVTLITKVYDSGLTKL